MNNRYQDLFKKEHQKLVRAKQKCQEKHKRFETLKVAAKCTACPIHKGELYLSLEQKFQKCKPERPCRAVAKYYQELVTVENDELKVREEYARKIFEMFCRSLPALVRCQTGEKVKWTDAFGVDYKRLSVANKKSLVALIEEDGGQYRITED